MRIISSPHPIDFKIFKMFVYAKTSTIPGIMKTFPIRRISVYMLSTILNVC